MKDESIKMSLPETKENREAPCCKVYKGIEYA